MLSRLATSRTRFIGPLLAGDKQWRLVTAVKRRDASGEGGKVILPREEQPSVAETLSNWDKAHQLYYGPERDTVNFPIKKCAETNPPVRLGFIPDTWFQALYSKTGVTGPYMFGFGFLTYVLSKEIWIVEHNFNHFCAFWLAIYIITKKYGKQIGAYLDSYNEQILDRTWYKPKEETRRVFNENITELEKNIWREDGQKYLFEAKRENVDLQLESVYRQRLAEVYQTVKNRLDYHVEVVAAKKRIEQEHMVDWIVNKVMSSITPQQEKETLTKCLTDLKSLQAKAKLA